jgi:hypothetical protein
MARKYTVIYFLVLFCVVYSTLAEKKRIQIADENSNFQIGAGIYDITGPPGEVGMMGYAMMVSKSTLHLISF